MIHGEHYDARISSQAAKAAALPGPWRRNDATEIINFLAKSVQTDFATTGISDTKLLKLQIDHQDLLHILETGICFLPANETTRKNIFKYKILGSCLDKPDRQIIVTVVPDNSRASLSVIDIDIVI